MKLTVLFVWGFLVAMSHCQTLAAENNRSQDYQYARAKSKDIHVWVTTGLWWPVLEGYNKAAFSLSLNYQRKSHLFEARYVVGSDDVCFVCDDRVGQNYQDCGVLYGKVLSAQNITISAAAGPGVTTLETTYPYAENEKRTKLGLALSGQLYFQPIDFPGDFKIGLGVYGFGNLNPAKSFGGFTVNLQFFF